MVEVAPAQGPGDGAEKLAEQVGRGAPDRVADQLEEVDRPLQWALAPALLPEDLWLDQLHEWHVEDALHFRRGRTQVPAASG